MNNSVIMYQQKQSKENPLTKDETNNLIRLAQSGSVYARNHIVENNLGMVVYIVGRFYNYVPRDLQDDYFQEGVIGLMKAIEGFNPELGFEFSTYAFWWIRQRMQRYGMDHSSLIRMPIYAQEIKKMHERSMDQDPTQDEEELIQKIAIEKGATVRNVKDIIASQKSLGSLDVPSEDGSTQIGEIPQELVGLTDIDRSDLDELLCELPFNQYRLVKLRLQGRTLREIADTEGLSGERIRQILYKATMTLRKLATKGSAE